MSKTFSARLTHAFLSLLLSAGLVFPLLGILEPSFLVPSVLLPVAAAIVLFELAALKRVTAVIAAVAGAAALVFWLVALDGLTAVSDVARAVSLRVAGVRSALPLVARPAVLMIAVFLTLVSCVACLRGVSCFPAVFLCVGLVLLLYLTGSASLIPWALPALAALLLLLMTDRFPETPLLHAAPWALLLVLAAFWLTAGGVPDNPLQQKADELRQAVLDRLFFTEPRDVFSLSSEGYYPEGMDQLGGKPEPRDTPVMQVSAPRTVYLRGVVLNEYTGRSWVNTTGGRRYLWQSARLSTQRASLFDQLLPEQTVRNAQCDPVTVSVRMLSDSASTLFTPQRVRELSPGGELVPYFSNASEIFITRNLQPGDSYAVSAPLFMAGDPGLGTLIEICSTLEDSNWDSVAETYTELPSHLEQPVYELAREAASAGNSPYDRALALQAFLSRGFRYTLDVDDQPANVDFVTRFLLDTKEGYCTYFASAMTVLCRMVGLPARYVEGYVAEPDQNGEAVVTGLSAHAWTEVYFKGFGWLTFDATPRSGGDQSGPEENPPTPSPEPESSPEPTDTPSPEPDQPDADDPTPTPASDEPSSEPTPESTPSPSDEPSPPPQQDPDPDSEPEQDPSSPSFPWLWLLLLLPLLLAVRVLMTSPGIRAARAKVEDARLDIWAQEITDLLCAEGLTRRRDESPMAFGRRIDRTGIFTVALGPVGECLSLIRYSRAQAQATDTSLLQDTALLLRAELSRPARLRYFCRRLFLPGSLRAKIQ